jgi:cell division septal protein FtsQ
VSRRKPAVAPPSTPDAEVPPPELPGHDLPSPEVLDELLKAFSADEVDTTTLRKIDFDSPEVEELLAPTEPTPAPTPVAHPEPEVHVEVEVEAGPVQPVVVDPEPAVEVEVEGRDVAEDDAAVEVEVEGRDVAEGDVEVQGEVETAVDVEPPADPADGDPDAATSTTLPAAAPTSNGDGAATGRTIRIDASDDPPDAVYLAAGDPLLAASAAGRRAATPVDTAAAGDRSGDGTVFIDDQDIGAGATISLADASSATRIEPRMRERRIAVKRAAGRKRLRWALVVIAVLAVIVAGLAVLGSSLFSIKTVDVEGAVYADPAAVGKVVDELRGQPVLRVDTDRAERELEAIPWVEAARVSVDFPNSASIQLRERIPVASYQGPDGQFRVLDSKGRVLDVLGAQPVDYLLLVSADAPNLLAGQFSPQGYVAAASLARALTPEVRARAEAATVSADGSDLRLQLQGDIEVRFGPARDLVTKLVRLQTKLADLDDGGVSYIDVSTNEVTVG